MKPLDRRPSEQRGANVGRVESRQLEESAGERVIALPRLREARGACLQSRHARRHAPLERGQPLLGALDLLQRAPRIP